VAAAKMGLKKQKKMLEGQFWAEQFEKAPLIAFLHVKGGDTARRNALSDGLAAAGVTFKIAKNSAVRHKASETLL
jgi:ribosomal protein L10